MVRERNKKFIVGIVLCLVGVLAISGKHLYNFLVKETETMRIREFYAAEENNSTASEEFNGEPPDDSLNNHPLEIAKLSEYIAVIKIPKINLEKGLCKKNSDCNNLDQNIQILEESDYPDVTRGNFILAGHSGRGQGAYFRRLSNLSLGDEAIISYRGQKYSYIVSDIYEIAKTGNAEILQTPEKTTLTLITCKDGEERQIIVVCELKDVTDPQKP